MATYNANELMQVEYGQNGGILLIDTTAVTGDWTKIIIVADAVFNTLTSNYTKNGVSTAAVAADWGTVTAGTVLVGKFTAAKLTSGKVLLLN